MGAAAPRRLGHLRTVGHAGGYWGFDIIALLVGFGPDSGAAVAIVLVYRLILFWPPIPVGLGTYLSVR